MPFSYKERTNEALVTLAVEDLLNDKTVQGYEALSLVNEAGIVLEDDGSPQFNDYTEAIEHAEECGLLSLVDWDRAIQLAEYEESIINRADDDKHFGGES